MAETSFTITGLADLSTALKALPDVLERRYLGRAVLAGAKVIRDAARRRAPMRTDAKLKRRRRGGKLTAPGNLRRMITARLTKPEAGRVTARIGPKGSAFYGKFVELGTAHQPAEPYLRPALDEQAGEALTVMAESLRGSLGKAAQEARR